MYRPKRPGQVVARVSRAIVWLAALAVAGAVLLPVAYLALRAAAAGGETWAALARPTTLQAAGRTVVLAAGASLCAVAIGLPLAWLTTSTDLPGRRAWGVVLALPLVVPSYVAAYLYAAALGPRGALQAALSGVLGVERLPSIYGLPGALLAVVAVSYPFVLLSAQVAFQRLDPALTEAGRSLGRGRWATFRRVELPQVRPAVAAGALLVALYAVRDFGAVSLMRYETLTRGVFTQYRSAFDRTGAAAWSLLIVLLVVAVLGFEGAVARRATASPPSVRRGAGPRPVPLGAWRAPALALCMATAGLTLGLPAAMLGYWLARGLRAGAALGGSALGAAAGHSVLAAALAAAATLLAAAPVAWLAARDRRSRTRMLERAAHVGFALPGVVVALALVFFGVRYVPWAYQTLPMLVVAYVILFLPEGVGALRSALERVAPRLEECARSLGRSPLGVFRTVTWPLVAPGAGTAAALVFLTAMKELPATLILSPAGFGTLSAAVWSAVGDAYFARAAAPALVLVLLASVPTALLTARAPRRDR